MAKKNLQDIHPLVISMCEAISTNNTKMGCISKHLERANKSDHRFIEQFQDEIRNYLDCVSPKYCWKTEKKASRRKENDSIDIYGENDKECCVVEIDATRIDQIAQKFVSRLSMWGLETKKPLLYVAVLYTGSESHRRKEDCEKYIRYCNNILKACKGNESSVVGIYTDGNTIEVCDFNTVSSFKMTFPNDNGSVSYKSMVKSAKHIIKWYVENNSVEDFCKLKKVFGKFVDDHKSPSKYEVLETKIGEVYVSTDWREYGSRAYWNEFVGCCKKIGVTIKKQTIQYPSKSTESFIYV